MTTLTEHRHSSLVLHEHGDEGPHWHYRGGPAARTLKAARAAGPGEVVRCAHVDVYDTRVDLVFHADLTPIEAVAAFLRDLSDAGMTDALYHVADQLDPPANDPATTAAPAAETGA